MAKPCQNSCVGFRPAIASRPAVPADPTAPSRHTIPCAPGPLQGPAPLEAGLATCRGLWQWQRKWHQAGGLLGTRFFFC